MRLHRSSVGRIVVAMVLVAMMLLPATANAAPGDTIDYLSLGDSIAHGTGGTNGIGYVEYLAGQLDPVYDLRWYDMSRDGMTSAELRQLVWDPANADAIAGAEVITISIGGNDILQPVLAFLATQDLAEFQSLPLYEQFLRLVLSGTMDDLADGVNSMASNWPYIIGRVRQLNPNAQVCVNLLYNPFEADTPLRKLADGYVQCINKVITWTSQYANYTVIDVYGTFTALASPEKPLVWGIDSPVALHPTDDGYKVIYVLHRDALTLN